MIFGGGDEDGGGVVWPEIVIAVAKRIQANFNAHSKRRLSQMIPAPLHFLTGRMPEKRLRKNVPAIVFFTAPERGRDCAARFRGRRRIHRMPCQAPRQTSRYGARLATRRL